MDFNGSGSSRFHRHGRSPSSDRFLAVYCAASALDDPSPSLNTNEEELNEDDIFTTDISQVPIASPSSSSSSSPSSLSHRNLNRQGIFRSRSSFKSAEASGILAALPGPSGNTHHHRQLFNHKAAAISPSFSLIASSLNSSGAASAGSSTARVIPSIPKPPHERIPSFDAGRKYPQSAPMNVPLLSQRIRHRHREFDDVDLDEEDEEGEMLPPHEIVARSLAQSPILSCSVLDGAGRTLKGSDLRRVRNAVFRETGFID